MKCKAVIERGPRRGEQCGRRASSIVTAEWRNGMPVCGVHARAWLPWALARIAYYDSASRSWP